MNLIPSFGCRRVAFAVLAVLASAGISDASAQPYLTINCGGNPCTVPAGNYSSPVYVDITAPTTDITVTAQGSVAVQVPQSSSFILDLNSTGAGGTSTQSGPAGAGQTTGTLSVTNSGALSMSGSTTDAAQGLWPFVQGGTGGSYQNSDAKSDAGSGGAGGTVSLTNTGSITFTGGFTGSALALIAQSAGGPGGSVTSKGTDGNGLPTFDNGGDGGTGGSGGTVRVTNSGAITIGTAQNPVAGGVGSGLDVTYAFETPQFGVRGISATSHGSGGGSGSGSAGSACDTAGSGCLGGAVGGNGGSVTVANAAPVSIVWDWGLTSGSPRLPELVGFGIVAASTGANGQPTYTEDYSGGAGGGAGSMKITLNAGGNVSLTSLHDVPTGFTPNTTSINIGAPPR